MEQLTPEQNYDDMLNLVWEKASPMYVSADKLDYHNREHPIEGLAEARRLADLCELHGLEVERHIIELAILGHDILYFVPQIAHPSISKEQYSAEVCGKILYGLGLDTNSVKKVQACILFTEPGSTMSSVCDDDELTDVMKRNLIITRRADIKNLGGSKIEFLSNSVKLYYESKTLHKIAGTQPLPWPDFVMKQAEYLKMLLDEDLSLGAFDTVFMKTADDNIDCLLSEFRGNISDIFRKYGREILRLLPNLASKE